MKPPIVEITPDANPVIRHKTRPFFVPAVTPGARAFFENQQRHLDPVFATWPIAVVDEVCPPLPQAPGPEPQKPKPAKRFSFHFATVLHWIARIKRKFFS